MAEESSTQKVSEMAKMLSDMEMARIKKDALENMNLVVSAIKCSYCGKLYKDDEERDMGFESATWAVCSPCFRKWCDIMLNKNTIGGAK